MQTMTETEARHYWRDRASDTLANMALTPRELVRAAQVLRAQYDAPCAAYDARGATLPTWEFAHNLKDVAHMWEDSRDVKPVTVSAPYVPRVLPDARAFDGREGGGVPSFPSAPSAWEARKHDLHLANGKLHGVRGRSRVQGSCVGIDDTPLGASPALLAQVLADLPRNSVGALGTDVSRVTHVFYGRDAHLEPLLGNDTIAAGEAPALVAAIAGARVRGVVGYASADAPDKRITWPTRMRLRMPRARTGELVKSHPEWLLAPAEDSEHVYVGFRRIPRSKVAPRKARTVKLERTVGTMNVADPAALPSLLVSNANAMNRGERACYVCGNLRLTLTRGSSGKYAVKLGAGKTVGGLRTLASVGENVTRLLAAAS